MKNTSRRLRLAVLALTACGGLWLYLPDFERFSAHALSPGPIQSSPIILNSADRFLWVVNPDNDSVSVIDVGGDANVKAQDIPVGDEPQSLAFNGDNTKVYVANAASGTVSVIATSNFTVINTITVGTEPWALAFTPNGKRLYVANSSSNDVSVINPKNDRVIRTIPNVGVQPRAIAITNDGDFQDNDEKVYVTSFLAQYVSGEIRPGEDLGKVGHVSVISTATNTVSATPTVLQPLADTGFKSNGSALPFVAPGPAGTFAVTTGAFPNILAGLAIKGNKLYVPSTGSSPNGPFRFNVNAQSLISIVDTTTDVDTGQTVNLNREIAPEQDEDIPDLNGNPVPRKRFVTNPYFIAFLRNGNAGYVISAASDVAFKFDLNAAGAPTLTKKDGKIVPILANKNPRAMVINTSDTRGYIWNYVSRDVTVVDLTTDTAIDTVASANLPVNAVEREVQRGKELFNSSIGPLSLRDGGFHEGMMSDRGWLSCASCHPDGLTDAVVWFFPPGPRFTTPLNATFERVALGQQGKQRALNWTANRDEVEDFELNTRAVAGGLGLIGTFNAQGVFTPDPNVFDLLPVASRGRSADRDAITTYVRHGIRSPISPIADNDPAAAKGRLFFEQAGCVACHGGAQWTKSTVEFPPPPPATEVGNEAGPEQLVGQLDPVGTFDPTQPLEVRGNQANLGQQAQGQLGFNTPSLLGIFALGPYLHNGTIVDLDDILDNPAHVGTSPILTKPKKRAKLVQFLKSIDDSTPPFN